jgi:hypothetical protein
LTTTPSIPKQKKSRDQHYDKTYNFETLRRELDVNISLFGSLKNNYDMILRIFWSYISSVFDFDKKNFQEDAINYATL